MARDNDMDFGLSPDIERLSAQLARDPKSKLFIPLAEEYMKADMAVEAVMTLEEGLKAHPAYMSARVLLGKAHLMNGDMDKACEQFENVIKAVPDNLFALKKLGEIYLAQGRREESLKNFRILSLLSPKDEELNDLIARLEAGELPPSPLKIAEPAPKEPLAEQVKETVKAKAVPETVEEAVDEGAEPEAVLSEDDSPEGAAPVYEIEDEDAAEANIGKEMPEPAEEVPGPSGIFDVQVPAPDEESPFDMAEDIPYQSGDAPTLDLDDEFPAGETGGEGGIFDLGQEPETEMPEAGGEAGRAADGGAGLEDIFSTYGGETKEEETAGADAGVYELEEPSDLDLEALGVKTQMSPVLKTGEDGEVLPAASPFDIEGESDLTVPSDMPFDLSAEGGPEDMPFGQEPERGAGGDMPFGLMDEGEAGLEDMLFETPASHETGQEEESALFEIEAEGPSEESGAFEPEDTFGEFGMELEPVERSTTEAAGGDVSAESAEPIKTETLAEMYVRQGFYDRAINIYKEMLREAPDDNSLKQKLEELYMLAGISAARAASQQESEAEAEPPGQVEPADFVMAAGTEAEAEDPWEMEASRMGEPPAPKTPEGGEEAVRKLKSFLDNIRRKGSQ